MFKQSTLFLVFFAFCFVAVASDNSVISVEIEKLSSEKDSKMATSKILTFGSAAIPHLEQALLHSSQKVKFKSASIMCELDKTYCLKVLKNHLENSVLDHEAKLDFAWVLYIFNLERGRDFLKDAFLKKSDLSALSRLVSMGDRKNNKLFLEELEKKIRKRNAARESSSIEELKEIDNSSIGKLLKDDQLLTEQIIKELVRGIKRTGSRPDIDKMNLLLKSNKVGNLSK